MGQFISGELRKIFRISSHILLIGLTVNGKYAWSTVLILQEQLCISELFRTRHSGRKLVDPSSQDNVVIQSNFLIPA